MSRLLFIGILRSVLKVWWIGWLIIENLAKLHFQQLGNVFLKDENAETDNPKESDLAMPLIRFIAMFLRSVTRIMLPSGISLDSHGAFTTHDILMIDVARTSRSVSALWRLGRVARTDVPKEILAGRYFAVKRGIVL